MEYFYHEELDENGNKVFRIWSDTPVEDQPDWMFLTPGQFEKLLEVCEILGLSFTEADPADWMN